MAATASRRGRARSPVSAGRDIPQQRLSPLGRPTVMAAGAGVFPTSNSVLPRVTAMAIPQGDGRAGGYRAGPRDPAGHQGELRRAGREKAHRCQGSPYDPQSLGRCTPDS